MKALNRTAIREDEAERCDIREYFRGFFVICIPVNQEWQYVTTFGQEWPDATINDQTIHCNKRYLKWSSPLENCSSGNGKRPLLGLEHFYPFLYWYFTFLHAGNVFQPQEMDFCPSRGGKTHFWGGNFFPRPCRVFLHPHRLEKNSCPRDGIFPPLKTAKIRRIWNVV